MKKLLLIATGGTIASKPTDSGLAPELTSEEILEFVPEIKEICYFDSCMPFCVDSTNIIPENWIEIAQVIKTKYNEYDGFVITHGTDTLSYTAAALSYMIQKSPKPIVLTGSQKSIYLRDTDARNNLIDAFTYAADQQACGVKVVFNGQVILGTRARKTKTHSYNAFDSIDYPAVAIVTGNRVIHYILPNIEKYKNEGPIFNLKMDPSVFLLKLTPGMRGSTIETLGKMYRAIIIEAFGQGGLPDHGEDTPRDAVDRYTKNGGLVAITTQVPYEGSNLNTYKVGRELCDNPNVIEGGNMTIEALTCKLIWVLGQTTDDQKTRELFYEPVDFDIL